MSHGLKPFICNGFQPPNCPHWQLCAAVHFRSFASDGFWPHRSGNTFPDWSEDKRSLHTGSTTCGPFYEKVRHPILCPAAVPQPESICRPAIGKCSGRRCRHPIHRPTVGNSHCHYCSTHALAFEPGEIVDSLNVVNLTFSFPFSKICKEKGGLLPAQTAPWNYSGCSFFCFCRSRCRLPRSR